MTGILLVTIPTALTIFGSLIVFLIRTEHRLTKIETKVDLLLNHNGIKPKKED